MKRDLEHRADIFTVQTLFDGQWRNVQNFSDEKSAQRHAQLLVSDWGSARVRLLLGRIEAESAKREYIETPIVPAKQWNFDLTDRLGQATGSVLRSIVSRRHVFAGLSAILLLLGLSAVSSYPTFAGNDDTKIQEQSIAQSQAPIAKNILQLFKEISNVNYAVTKTLNVAPVRLHGDWSLHCASGTQDLQISKDEFLEFDGAVAKEYRLEAVFQSGQTYGLVTDQDEVRILELAGVDRMQLLGFLNNNGQFIASAEGLLLHRCL